LGTGQMLQLHAEKKLEFQFARRAKCDVEEVNELSVSTSPASLGHVRSDRNGSSPHLGGEAESLTRRELGGGAVEMDGQ